MKYFAPLLLLALILASPVAAQHPAFVTTGGRTSPGTDLVGQVTTELMRVLNTKSYVSSVTYGDTTNLQYSAYNFRVQWQRIDDHAAAIVLVTLVRHVGPSGSSDYWVATGVRLVADDGRAGAMTPSQAVAGMIKYLEDPPNPFPSSFENYFH
jgi:hypothetical protein